MPELPATRRLLEDSALLVAHRAMLAERKGERRYDPSLLIGLAKLADATGLTEALEVLSPGELAAVLGDLAGVDRLVRLAAGS